MARGSRQSKPIKVALAHDWLTGMRGGEAVLEHICQRYPKAPLFTLLSIPGSVSQVIASREIISSFIDRIPGAHNNYRHFLPLFPSAVERLDASNFDLVVSTSHCAIKALPIGKNTVHVCYVHTPMRYIYDQFDDYFGEGRASLTTRTAMATVRPMLQRWDARTARRPSWLIANSKTVAARISRYWGRRSEVIYPPVCLGRFAPVEKPSRDYYLVVGAMAPYKRVDIAIEAFSRMEKPLWVVGEGQDAQRLRRCSSDNIRFLGRVGDAELRGLYANARALIFPGEEDFGIIPLEAQACGTPVIAYGRGGATETVLGLDQPDPTGVFFYPQTAEALLGAVHRFEASDRFAKTGLLDHAATFSEEIFRNKLFAVLERAEQRAEQLAGCG